MKQSICINHHRLGLDALVAVSRHGTIVELSEEVEETVRKTEDFIDRLVEENRRVYGVTTGFGALSDVAISREDAAQLQINILMSHAAGVGPPLGADAARGLSCGRMRHDGAGPAAREL